MKNLFGFISVILILSIVYMSQGRGGVEKENTLTVGTNAEYKPYCFIDHGDFVGFDIDVAKEIAKRLGKELEIIEPQCQRFEI